MQLTRPVALASLLFTGACASRPGSLAAQDTAGKTLRGGIAEFRLSSYDGRVLEGRVLLGATIDPLVIDGRLVEAVDVEVAEVHACGTTEPLKYWVMESLPSPPRADQIVTLRRGYWHGANVDFPLFDEKATGLGPDCFEAELVLRALDGRVAARLPIRVVRTEAASPDGAAKGSKPSPSDAGAP